MKNKEEKSFISKQKSYLESIHTYFSQHKRLQRLALTGLFLSSLALSSCGDIENQTANKPVVTSTIKIENNDTDIKFITTEGKNIADPFYNFKKNTLLHATSTLAITTCTAAIPEINGMDNLAKAECEPDNDKFKEFLASATIVKMNGSYVLMTMQHTIFDLIKDYNDSHKCKHPDSYEGIQDLESIALSDICLKNIVLTGEMEKNEFTNQSAVQFHQSSISFYANEYKTLDSSLSTERLSDNKTPDKIIYFSLPESVKKNLQDAEKRGVLVVPQVYDGNRIDFDISQSLCSYIHSDSQESVIVGTKSESTNINPSDRYVTDAVGFNTKNSTLVLYPSNSQEFIENGYSNVKSPDSASLAGSSGGGVICIQYTGDKNKPYLLPRTKAYIFAVQGYGQNLSIYPEGEEMVAGSKSVAILVNNESKSLMHGQK